MTHPGTDDDDVSEWREFVGTVSPLGRDRTERIRMQTSRQYRPAARSATERDSISVHLPLNTDRKVRRGKVVIDGRLDMHGLRAHQAPDVLVRFVADHARRGCRCLLVVTGKGRSSEGVLRASLPEWLGSLDCRVHVWSYAPAHRAHGGAGAWYLFLRAPSSRADVSCKG